MNTDSLLVLAEIGAGFIGFSAVATVLTKNRTELQSFYFKSMVILCIATIWAALIPTWMEGEFENLWLASTIAMLAIGGLTLPFTVCDLRRIGLEGLKFAGGAAKAVALVQLVQLALFFSVFVGWPFEASQKIYEILICLWLTMAALMFIDYVFVTNEDA